MEHERSGSARRSPAETEREHAFPPGLAAPARRALANAGYTHLGELAGVPEEELKRLHGMGPKALGQLRAALAAKGLTFAGG